MPALILLLHHKPYLYAQTLVERNIYKPPNLITLLLAQYSFAYSNKVNWLSVIINNFRFVCWMLKRGKAPICKSTGRSATKPCVKCEGVIGALKVRYVIIDINIIWSFRALSPYNHRPLLHRAASRYRSILPCALTFRSFGTHIRCRIIMANICSAFE